MSANAAGARSSRSCACEATAEIKITLKIVVRNSAARKRIAADPGLQPAPGFNLRNVEKLHLQQRPSLLDRLKSSLYNRPRFAHRPAGPAPR
jgi:hypothetical protein